MLLAADRRIAYQDPEPQPRAAQYVPLAGAWDCHAHIFGPEQTYRVTDVARFRNPRADAADYSRVLSTLGLARAVIVQPHVYGTDNRCAWDALAGSGGAWRGVAVIDPRIGDDELGRMHEAGFRGVRFNLRNADGLRPGDLPLIAARIRPLGWHVEFAADAGEMPLIESHTRGLPVDFVIPHMGRVPAAAGVHAREFQILLGMLRDRRCWVKLSAAHRMTALPYPHADVRPFVDALLDAAVDRLLWASDWPHTSVPPSAFMPADGDLVDLFASWVPDEAQRRKILVENPFVLYETGRAYSTANNPNGGRFEPL